MNHQFKLGDRVRVLSGAHVGEAGTIVSFHGEQLSVKLDHHFMHSTYEAYQLAPFATAGEDTPVEQTPSVSGMITGTTIGVSSSSFTGAPVEEIPPFQGGGGESAGGGAEASYDDAPAAAADFSNVESGSDSTASDSSGSDSSSSSDSGSSDSGSSGGGDSGGGGGD